MLTSTQALRIVINCIKAMYDPQNLQVTDPLEDVGFQDQPRVNLLRKLIVSSETNGVPSKQHKLSASHLAGMDPTWTVSKVADVVEQKSKPV